MIEFRTGLRTFVGTCAISMLALTSAMADTAPAPKPKGDVPAQTQTETGKEGEYTPVSGQEGKDVVWVPTPQALVDRMLELAQVTQDDYLVDLGSGDGRTVISAAKRGVRARGIEYNPKLVALSKRNAEKEGVTELATFEEGDIFEKDFKDATVITLFLLPSLNERLRPTLLEMKPGTRIVSNSFGMGEWEPDETAEANQDCTTYCDAKKWIVPAQVSGNWQIGKDRLELGQTFQKLKGSLNSDGKALPISEAKMNGTEITFTVDGKRYSGVVDGDKIEGTIEGGGAWTATRSAN